MSTYVCALYYIIHYHLYLEVGIYSSPPQGAKRRNQDFSYFLVSMYGIIPKPHHRQV